MNGSALQTGREEGEAGPADRRLRAGEVHLWRADLEALATRSPWRESLSEDEIERADRFRFERDRRRFVVRRGVLRALLGRYLGRRPGELRFRTSRHGKPSVAVGGDRALEFSTSHSNGVGLVAIGRSGPLGVDLECVLPDRADLDVAERFFAPGEVRALRGLEDDQRIAGFFNCWTRKEAYVKARGEGLSLALDAFEVSLVPGDEARLVWTDAALGPAHDWTMLSLDAGSGYAAALVTRCVTPTLRIFDAPSSIGADDESGRQSTRSSGLCIRETQGLGVRDKQA